MSVTYKTTDRAAEIVCLEFERDALDHPRRWSRRAGVETVEKRRERDIERAGIEVADCEVGVPLARFHVEATERRFDAIDDVDPDAVSRSEAKYLAEKVVFDEL